MTLLGQNGKRLHLKKTFRKSPTLLKKPPNGAIILFDGTNKDEWIGGRLDKTAKFLNTDGKDIVSKKSFNDYQLHLNFYFLFDHPLDHKHVVTVVYIMLICMRIRHGQFWLRRTS